MTYLETIKSQNGQIYPEDTFSLVAAHIKNTSHNAKESPSGKYLILVCL